MSAATVRSVAASVRKHTTAKHEELASGADDLDKALEGVPAELLARG